MAAWTLAEAKTYLQEALDARARILRAQGYSVDDYRLDRPDLNKVREEIQFWSKEVDRLSSGGIKARRTIPRDD